MRFHIVLRYVALALLLNALFLGISAAISYFNGDKAMMPLLYSGLVTALFAIFPLIFVPPASNITNKEGLLIVVLSWLLSCLVGALPVLSKDILFLPDYLEAVTPIQLMRLSAGTHRF